MAHPESLLYKLTDSAFAAMLLDAEPDPNAVMAEIVRRITRTDADDELTEEAIGLRSENNSLSKRVNELEEVEEKNGELEEKVQKLQDQLADRMKL